MAFTIAVREKGKAGPFRYIGTDGHVHDTTHGCKSLSRDEAGFAKQLICAGAAKAGRPIDCRVVRLVGREPA